MPDVFDQVAAENSGDVFDQISWDAAGDVFDQVDAVVGQPMRFDMPPPPKDYVEAPLGRRPKTAVDRFLETPEGRELARMYPDRPQAGTTIPETTRILSDGSSVKEDYRMYSLGDDLKHALPEVPKGFVRGYEQANAAVGSGVEAVGDWLDAQGRMWKRLYYESPIGQKVLERRRKRYIAEHGSLPGPSISAAPETLGGRVSDAGQDVYDFWQEAANTGWERRNPEVYAGSLRENPSITRIVGGASESAPTMLGALALSAAGAPGMGLTLLTASEALPTYTEAKRMGASEGDAFSYALLSGIGTAALERVGINSILGKSPAVNALVEKMGQKWVAGALVNFAVEGTQEAAQEMWQNAVAMGYDGDRELFDNALEAGVTGGILGGGSSIGVSIMNDYMQRQADNSKGLTPEQIDAVVRDNMRPAEQEQRPSNAQRRKDRRAKEERIQKIMLERVGPSFGPQIPEGTQDVPRGPQVINVDGIPEDVTQPDKFQPDVNLPVVRLPVADLKLSKDVPNFKEDSDPTTGVVHGQRLQGQYNELGTAPIVVWERKDKSLEVVSGRHRLDLARRTEKQDIPAHVVREADGFTAQDALTLDSELNIRDGQGKVKDYANYFRQSGLTPEEASGRGLLARQAGKSGWALGRLSGDNLYTAYRNRKIAEQKAVAIAEAAPNNDELQRVGLDYALANDSANAEEVRQYVNAIKSMIGRNTVEDLDLFGNNDAALNEARKLARVALKLQNRRRNERKVLKGARTVSKVQGKNAEVLKQYGIEQGDVDAMNARIDALDSEIDAWNHWPTSPDLVDQLRAEAGLPPAQRPQTSPEQSQQTAETSQDAPVQTEAKPVQGDIFDQVEVESQGMGRQSDQTMEALDSLNPTGSVFADYTPEQRMAMPLGDNITTLDKTSGESPDTQVTIYRGVSWSKQGINPGDFVTTNKQLAQDYAGGGVVVSKTVRMADVLDDKTEPLGEEYIYRPAQSETKAPSFLDKLEADARAEIETLRSGGTMGMNKPVGIAANYVVIGAVKIARGTSDFAKWSAEMVREFGDAIKPHLRAIFDAARKVAAANPQDYKALLDSARAFSADMPGVNDRFFGRPDLSQVAESPEVRSAVAYVDEQRNLQGLPERQTFEQWKQVADDRLAANADGEWAALQAGRLNYADPVDTMVARKLVEQRGVAALQGEDSKAIVDLMDAVFEYRSRRSDLARAMAAGRDQVEAPQERARRFLMEAMLDVPLSVQQKLERATAEQRKKILEKESEKVQKLREDLAKAGIDVANLSEETLNDPYAVGEILRQIQTRNAGTADKVMEYWRNAILSGPATQAANVIGNTANSVWEYGVQRMAEAALNKVLRVKGGATFGESLYVLRAVLPSMIQASRNAVVSFSTEQPASGEFKLDRKGVAIRGTKGRIIRIPQRMLVAADEFSKGMIDDVESAALAYRQAKEEGLKGDALQKRMAELVKDPNIRQQADDKATELTFQAEPGALARWLMNWQRVPGLRWVEFILPFVKTPANIVKIGVRKSPLGSVRLGAKAIKGDYAGNRSQLLHDAAEQVVAWSAMLALWAMTGGDEDDPWITGSAGSSHSPGKKDFERRHFPAQSIRIGNKWYSYARIEPMATSLTIMVDSINNAKAAKQGQYEKAMGDAWKSAQSLVRDKTFLRGVGDIIRATEDEYFARTWVENFAVSWVPNLVRSGMRSTDPVWRDYKNRHEGAEWWKVESHRLLQKAFPMPAIAPEAAYDPWGRERTKGEGFGPATDVVWRMMVPIYINEAPTINNAERMVFNYNQKRSARGLDEWWPGYPSDRFTEGGIEYRMDTAQYNEFLKRRGVFIEDVLKDSDFDFDNPSADDIERLQNIFKYAGIYARSSMGDDGYKFKIRPGQVDQVDVRRLMGQ